MWNLRGLGLHFIFICVFLIATTDTCLGVGNTSVVCSEQERLALLKFKNSVRDDFRMLSSWVGKDCCKWERVQCDNVTGNVHSLHLRGDIINFDEGGENYLLAGNEVNSCLAELRHLKYLDLGGNNFQGSRIPEFIGSLKQLSHLNLSNANFQGTIPHHIGNLSNLKVLDLSSNYWLRADDISWTFGLSSLEHLDLSRVNLSGAKNWDMVLHMFPSLKQLSFSGCELSGANIGLSLNSSRILPNIKHLDLSYNHFIGPLPASFQNMTSLAFLDLSSFDLSLASNFADLLNMIPSLLELHLSSCLLNQTHLSSPHLNFSTLSNIQHLDLQENSIEGIFPYFLANMSSLKVLDLSDNGLNSSVPNMPSLLELDISYNMFKKIENVGIWRLCHLKHLSAGGNPFDREMTDSPKNASECSQYALEMLDLRFSLNGTFPEPLERLINLRSLCLAVGSLTGPIPESLTRLSFLEELDLSYNLLNGRIPESLTRLSFLEELDLSYNLLTGPIPESLTRLSFLKELDLSDNLLTGPIPTFLGGLVSLQTISVGSNMLNGSIPDSIGQLSRLCYLDVSNNSLEGVVSEPIFSNLSLLKMLDTSSNIKLTFNVSREWIPPFQLIRLQLSSCNIGNEFPQWLQHQRNLETLELSNVSISGPLPTWLRKIPIILWLDLSHNKLSGPLTNLPTGGKFYISYYEYNGGLFLENNLFNESIPRSLCRMADLLYLDLSVNRLTGKIPKCLQNLQQLETMRFSSNMLSGVIPSSIALGCSSLRWLSLRNNSFIGELPRELGNLQGLYVLDLGENNFSGKIPEWVGESLTSLMVFRLHKNNFTGRIPRSLCKITTIQILDLAHNKLMGSIPDCLGQLTAMVDGRPESWGYNSSFHDDNVIQVMKGSDLEYTTIWRMVFNIDLSSNNLVGGIPIELTALLMLVGLNLSNNHLTGGIPDNIGNLTKLESLDFSENELTGEIPPSMAALTCLSKLNLSHNNLSGEIPKGNQLQTLDDPSIYAGNKGLCGLPLPNDCSNHQASPTTPKKKDKASDEVWLFGLDIMGGFAIGFWGVIGVLLFTKHWRHKLFMFAEDTGDKIYVAVVVTVAKFKRGREAT